MLAPFYDLLSTRIYPTLSVDLAMSIGGEFASDAIRRDHWMRMAQEMGVKEKLVLKTMEETSRLVLAASKALFLEEFREYRSDALYRLQQHISLTAERVGKMAW